MVTLADARQRAMAFLREIADPASHGDLPMLNSVGLKTGASGPTLSEIITSYAELYLPSIRSGAGTKATLSQPALSELHRREAAGIQRREIIAVLDGMVAQRPHAAVNLLKALRAMYNWAIDRDLLAINPCDRIRPPAKTTQRDRILTDSEIVSVLGACDAVPKPFGDLVRLLLHTGARRNELAEMRWSELEGNIWTLPAARSKSSRSNRLPLPPAVMAVIIAQFRSPEGDGYVLSTTAGLRPSTNFDKNLRALHAASATSGWTLHDLRRTARTKFSQLGVDRDVSRRIVGHAGDTLDATYDHYSFAREKGEALATLAIHLADLLHGS